MSLMGNMFDAMNNWGFFDFLFPWLLILAISYGILQTKQIISSEVSVNGTIAVVFAFFVAYMIKGTFLTEFFGLSAVLLLVLFAGLVIAGLAGIKMDALDGNWIKYGFLGIGIVAAIAAFLSAGGLDLFNFNINFRIDTDLIISIVIIIIMVAAIVWIAKGAKS